jgi:hypothetical protein
MSCNDNAVIEIQHTQNIFDLQTPFVEILAGFFLLQTAIQYNSGHKNSSSKLITAKQLNVSCCLK